MPFRLNLKLKIVLGYLFIIFCLGISIFVVVGRLSSLQDELDFIADHDIEVHESINQIQINMLGMVRGQLGYINTGAQSYKEDYNESKVLWQENYNTLYDLIKDNSEQQAKLVGIKSLIENWIEVAGDPPIQMRDNNEAEELTAFLQKNPGKTIVEQTQEEIDLFRTTEKALTKQRTDQLEANNNNLKLVLYLVLFVVAAGSIAVALFISNSITGTVKQVIQSITRMSSSNGDLQSRIQVSTKDEIKDLAEATNKLLDTVEEQSWIQSNIANISNMYQGITHVSDLGSAFLSNVAPMLDALYGAVYMKRSRDGKQLYEQIAAFAGGNDPGRPNAFAPGEGLIGQCAVDKRLFLVDRLPEQYVTIQSGLGSSVPASLLVVPVLYEGETVAVVELASLQRFSSKHLKLVDEVQESFGTAINSVLGRMEIERLLNESQMMTEELQAQSEELQMQSEELQMQQEQLRLANEYLDEQRQIAELRADELEAAKDDLEDYSHKLQQSSQYKTDFLANMSHELRTPLNSILILSQLLFENENKTLNQEEIHYSEVIHAAGKELLALIDDILDLSKIEAGKLEIVIDEINVTELPALLQQIFDPVARNKDIKLNIEIDPDAPALLSTDGHRLQHILKNLLSNAFKFTEEGSVTLSIGKAGNAVLQELYGENAPDEAVKIAVSDTGIGIPKDKQDVIFEAFKQVDGTTNRQYGGTGLGLSICREFARLLNGKITVESELGSGSTFTLYMPNISDEEAKAILDRASEKENDAAGTVITAAKAEELEDSSHEVAAGQHAETLFKGKRVLLVDDDARNVYALKAALASSGMDVTVASDGRDCLDVLEQDTGFDLILMDIMMPVMDGYETMRCIRQDDRLTGIPIIALTAKAMKSDRDKCLEAGASDYISKPLNMDQLFSLMRVWLTK